MKLWFAVLASLLANALGGMLYPASGYNGLARGYYGGYGGPAVGYNRPARGYYGGYGGPAVGYRGALGAGYYGGPGAAYGRPAAVLATGTGVTAADGVRNYANHANAAYNSGARAANYGRNSAAYDDKAARAAASAQQANNVYGHQAADYDRNANAASRAAHQAAADAYGRNHQQNGGLWNRADNYQEQGQGDQFHKGRRHYDNINYAYDKSFDRRDSDNGGVVLVESENNHALDQLRDRAASYNRNVDKDAAHASTADAKQAAHKAAAAQDAAARAATSDDFARQSANNAVSYSRNRDLANKVDHSKGASGVWDDARQSASDVYKNMAAKQGSYAHGGHAYAPGVYGLGLAAVPAYAPKPGYAPYGDGYTSDGAGYYGGAPYRAAPLAGPGYVGVDGTPAAGANNQAVRDGLRQSDAAARDHHLQNHYYQDQRLYDRNTGYDRNAHGAAADKGTADSARQAAQSAHKADAASAAVSRASEADNSKASFYEDVLKKEADRTRLSDRDNNHKVYKKWFNNKRRGGDNWERLKLDRDHRDDVFGYDSAFKKDSAKADDNSQWNSQYDANGRNAHAARAAAAAQDAHSDDWKKAADGHQYANAAADSRNAAQRNGWSNSAFDQGHARNAFDVKAGNGYQAHRDASRAGLSGGASGALGAGVGAGVGGLQGPGYGYGYSYGYPAGQYGYPGKLDYPSKLGYGSSPGYGYKPY